MKVWGIIPVRMASSRFPGKPLAKIHGIPMAGHVYYRCKMSRTLDKVWLTTCDEEIKAYADSIGAACVMTASSHERATDRTAEAVQRLETDQRIRADAVVMIQGDEPMVRPEMIDDAVAPLAADPSIQVVNLMGDITTIEEWEDPNEVKVVVAKDNRALYFSREPIPSRRKGIRGPMLKQVCVIPFRRDYLLKFSAMTPTPLETVESVDMMRILEHGERVQMVKTPHQTWSVDTSKDLARVERAMESDVLREQYLS